MQYRRPAIALAAAMTFATLSGCASMTPTQCASANWYQVGVADGAAGFPVERMTDHVQACSGHGPAPVAELYAEGHADGLVDYCTTANGLEAGRYVEAYRGVCPKETEAGFLTGYRLGAIAFRGD